MWVLALLHAPWSPSSHSFGTGVVGLVSGPPLVRQEEQQVSEQQEQQVSEQQEQQVSEQGGVLWQEGGAGAPVARGSLGAAVWGAAVWGAVVSRGLGGSVEGEGALGAAVWGAAVWGAVVSRVLGGSVEG